ncbi:hypothetical protein K443DRAFT_13387 [Laccaria amethystina LaAM-08-1]|uniref:Uncharacterized protein n=1 Tax=Laccaria amethystina LaAM-08-1 TaxID=1095629 RepID=A0A0C9X511_9AGAR|nr:hypothetical protein K443DRAFT_13387 [Laccaria amethystina LaAM-08-1]
MHVPNTSFLPFGFAPLPSAALSSLTLANPVPPTQGSSNADQHNFGAHSAQGVQELPQENTQKASKRPNKMRANKHSTTPRNLCAKEWVEQYHGTVEDFAAYFKALSMQELERYKALSKSLGTARSEQAN